ncbi:MAG TPA: hypothetical protein VMT86_14770 [Bryobacteraceae bacterium]|nr:hypothetical protein [Bryobacteraceae bacterium]
MADFRRWILALATLVLVIGCVAPASAQSNSLTCTAAASVTPTIRSEGYTELTGDILLTCSGAVGSAPTASGSVIPQATLSVSLTAPITSRILGGAAPQALTEAVLVVDDPTPANQDVCTSPTNPAVACQVEGDGGMTFNNDAKFNVFQGLGGATVPAPNTVTFLGVPIDPPATGSRTYRITNIRVNATAVPASSALVGFPIYAFVSVSPSQAMSITNPQMVVALAAPGLNPEYSGGATTPFYQCENTDETQVGTVTFAENFSTAFKIEGSSGQNTPGVVYNSESGLEIAGIPGSGAADSPTELQATISNIPVGAKVYVDGYASSPAAVYCGDSSLPGCVDVPSYANLLLPTAYTGTGTGIGNAVLVADNSAGTAPIAVTVVWEVMATNPSALDSLAFGIYASFAAQPGNPSTITAPTTVLGGFSPQLAAYSSSGPIPEFTTTPETGNSPYTLFTVSQCQTILLFPYVTDFYGFDTGIAISNTSMDNLPVGASQQTGSCSVAFYGNGGAATNLGTSGVYSSTLDTTLSDGNIAPGQTWAFSLSSIDPGYNSTTSYGTTGYAIATCNFQFAHGYSFVSDTGIRNFAAAYLALVIPDAPRNAQPFTCSATGSWCNLTGEQLVH